MDISQFQIVLLSSIEFSSKGSKLFAIPEGTSLHTDTSTYCSFLLYHFQKYPFKYVYTTQVRVVFAVGEFASASPTAPFTLIVGGAKRSLAKNTGKLQGQWQQLVAAISGSANYQFVLVRSSTSSINKFKMRIALPLLSLKSRHILVHTCSCSFYSWTCRTRTHVPPPQSCNLSLI